MFEPLIEYFEDRDNCIVYENGLEQAGLDGDYDAIAVEFTEYDEYEEYKEVYDEFDPELPDEIDADRNDYMFDYLDFPVLVIAPAPSVE